MSYSRKRTSRYFCSALGLVSWIEPSSSRSVTRRFTSSESSRPSRAVMKRCSSGFRSSDTNTFRSATWSGAISST